MNKLFFFILCLLTSIKACAAPCDLVPGKLSYEPFVIRRGVVCFVSQPAQDGSGKFSEGDRIFVYFVSDEEVTKVSALPYFGGAGKIEDVFLMDVNHNGDPEVIVIHSAEIQKENTSGIFYSVEAFVRKDFTLERDERVSEWYGSGYSWLNKGKYHYNFPFVVRSNIENALTSVYISLIANGQPIPAKVTDKAFLFKDASFYSETKKYLIEGDKVTVDKLTGDWCRINYTAGEKPLTMWMLCESLATERR